MVLSPVQTLAQRQDGEDCVRAVSDYTIGDLTVTTRATAKSWNRTRPWVRIFLDEPGTTIQYSIGEQMDQAALSVYQRSSFRTVSPRMYLTVVCTRLLIALKPPLKQPKIWQAVRMCS